jgi:hypothetical protein
MMRRLYLVPIIHMSADMGSIAPALDKGAADTLGPELLQRHRDTVSGFWDSLDRFFGSLGVKDFKVYQDGLVVDGEEGLKIVKEGIKHGSKNYQLVGELLKRGAVLTKTEDLPLVKREYGYLTKIAYSKSLKEREVAALRYRLAQSRLLRQRDSYIAQRINATLREGETGILFIGANHDVAPGVARDIVVTQVKELDRVREYHKTLLDKRRSNRHLQELAEYLGSPIPIH